MAYWLTHRLIGWPTNWLGRPTNWLTDWYNNSPTDLSPTDWLVCCLTYGLTCCQTQGTRIHCYADSLSCLIINYLMLLCHQLWGRLWGSGPTRPPPSECVCVRTRVCFSIYIIQHIRYTRVCLAERGLSYTNNRWLLYMDNPGYGWLTIRSRWAICCRDLLSVLTGFGVYKGIYTGCPCYCIKRSYGYFVLYYPGVCVCVSSVWTDTDCAIVTHLDNRGRFETGSSRFANGIVLRMPSRLTTMWKNTLLFQNFLY